MLKTCSTQSHEELITWQPFAHAQISSSDQLTLSEMLCWRSPVCLKPAVVCAMCRKLRVFGWNIPSGLRAEAVKRVGEYRGASVSDVVTPWGYIDKQAAGSSSKLTLHETGLFCCHWFFSSFLSLIPNQRAAVSIHVAFCVFNQEEGRYLAVCINKKLIIWQSVSRHGDLSVSPV